MITPSGCRWNRTAQVHAFTPMRSAFFVMLFLAISGCARTSPALVVVTAEERQLMTQLTRDPFVVIKSSVREEDGYVTIRTQQGNVVAYYRLMPAGDANPELTIRRLDEQLHLPVAWSEDHLGTGPADRGIHR